MLSPRNILTVSAPFRRSLVAFALLLTLCVTQKAQAVETFVDLGTLGGNCSYANGINDKGQVVGKSYTSSGKSHAFLYTNGSMTDLGTLGGKSSYANGINNKGQVVG